MRGREKEIWEGGGGREQHGHASSASLNSSYMDVYMFVGSCLATKFL